MFIRNSSRLILQLSHLLTKYTPRRSRKINFVKCNTYCFSSSYSASDCNESEYSLPDEDDVDEHNFETEELIPPKLMEELCSGDVAKLESLKRTQLFVHLLREKGDTIPTKLSEKQWLRLITYDRKRDQVAYLHRLHRREFNRKLAKTVSDISQNRYLKAKSEGQGPIRVTTSGPLIYRLRYNTLFYRLYDAQFDRLYNYRLMQAMMFAPTIVIDCGYESSLEHRYVDRTAIQIVKMWSQNRSHVSPFHFQFCNLNSQGRLMERIREVISSVDDPIYPFFHTSKSYLEMYPKEKLVYLTPDANHDLTRFDSDDIYILGGLSNTFENEPFCKMKAKEEGLRMARFPFKQYNVRLSSKQHSLDVNLASCILNDLKETNDWSYAFRHVNSLPHTKFDYHSKVHTLDHAIKDHHHLKLTYDLLLNKPQV